MTASTHKKGNCLARCSHSIDQFLHRLFGRVGGMVGRRPKTVILFCLVLTCLCMLGFLRFDLETNPENLYTPQDSNSQDHKVFSWNTFGYLPRTGHVYFVSKKGAGASDASFSTMAEYKNSQKQSQESVLSKDHLVEMMDAYELARAHTITYDGRVFTFDDLCSKPAFLNVTTTENSNQGCFLGYADPDAAGTEYKVSLRRPRFASLSQICVQQSVLDLWEYNRTLLESDGGVVGTVSAAYKEWHTYTVLGQPDNATLARDMLGRSLNMDQILGAVTYDTVSENLTHVSVFQWKWNFDNCRELGSESGNDRDVIADEFEQTLWRKVQSNFGSQSHDGFATMGAAQNAHIRTVTYTPGYQEEEEQRAISADVFLMVIGSICLGMYGILGLARNHRVYSRGCLSFPAVISVGLAIGSAYGLGMALGIQFSLVVQALVFILLGLGMDDAYVIMGEELQAPHFRQIGEWDQQELNTRLPKDCPADHVLLPLPDGSYAVLVEDGSETVIRHRDDPLYREFYTLWHFNSVHLKAHHERCRDLQNTPAYLPPGLRSRRRFCEFMVPGADGACAEVCCAEMLVPHDAFDGEEEVTRATLTSPSSRSRASVVPGPMLASPVTPSYASQGIEMQSMIVDTDAKQSDANVTPTVPTLTVDATHKDDMFTIVNMVSSPSHHKGNATSLFGASPRASAGQEPLIASPSASIKVHIGDMKTQRAGPHAVNSVRVLRQLSIPERLSLALAHAGSSILITSLTDLLAFACGAYTVLPALQDFCMFAALGIFFDFLYQVLFFVGFAALDLQRQRAGRVDFLWCCRSKKWNEKRKFVMSHKNCGKSDGLFTAQKADTSTSGDGNSRSHSPRIPDSPRSVGSNESDEMNARFASPPANPPVPFTSPLSQGRQPGVFTEFGVDSHNDGVSHTHATNDASAACKIPESGFYYDQLPITTRCLDKYVVPFVTSRWGQLTAVLVTVVILVFAAIGISNLNTDFSTEWFLADDSSLHDVFAIRDSYLNGEGGGNGGRGGVRFSLTSKWSPKWGVPGGHFKLQEQLAGTVLRMNGNKHIDSSGTSSWVLSYSAWLHANQATYKNYTTFQSHAYLTGLSSNDPIATVASANPDDGLYIVTNKTVYMQSLVKFLESDGAAFKTDVVFQPWAVGANAVHALNSTSDDFIVAQRSNFIFVPHGHIERAISFMDIAQDVSGATDTNAAGLEPGSDGRVQVYSFSVWFLFLEGLAAIEWETIRNLMIAVCVVFALAVVLLTEWRTSLLVGLMVLLVDVSLVGFLYWVDLEHNMVSMINLVLAVGIAVDYSFHLAHTFLSTPGVSKERVRAATVRIGGSVLNGGVSTFVAVCVLAFAQSYIFQNFFRCFFLTVTFGLFYGVVLLPCLLSLFGDDKEFEDDENEFSEDESDLSEK